MMTLSGFVCLFVCFFCGSYAMFVAVSYHGQHPQVTLCYENINKSLPMTLVMFGYVCCHAGASKDLPTFVVVPPYSVKACFQGNDIVFLSIYSFLRSTRTMFIITYRTEQPKILESSWRLWVDMPCLSSWGWFCWQVCRSFLDWHRGCSLTKELCDQTATRNGRVCICFGIWRSRDRSIWCLINTVCCPMAPLCGYWATHMFDFFLLKGGMGSNWGGGLPRSGVSTLYVLPGKKIRRISS